MKRPNWRERAAMANAVPRSAFPCPAAFSSLLFGRPGWIIQTTIGARLWTIDWVWRA